MQFFPVTKRRKPALRPLSVAPTLTIAGDERLFVERRRPRHGFGDAFERCNRATQSRERLVRRSGDPLDVLERLADRRAEACELPVDLVERRLQARAASSPARASRRRPPRRSGGRRRPRQYVENRLRTQSCSNFCLQPRAVRADSPSSPATAATTAGQRSRERRSISSSRGRTDQGRSGSRLSASVAVEAERRDDVTRLEPPPRYRRCPPRRRSPARSSAISERLRTRPRRSSRCDALGGAERPPR